LLPLPVILGHDGIVISTIVIAASLLIKKRNCDY